MHKKYGINHRLWKQIEKITNQIIDKYNPADIILFGSCAKGVIKKSSDIDLCVIMETDNKRQTLTEILLGLDYGEEDIDIIIYTPEEWDLHKKSRGTLAEIINRTGVSMLGRFQKV